MNGRTNITSTITMINGILISLEPITNLVAIGRDGSVELTWTDPVDKYATPGGELVAQWASSMLVRKTGSYPTSPVDGVRALVSKTRNQYANDPYTDSNLENGVHYYYAAYACTTLGAYSTAVTSDALPTEGVPSYKTRVSLTQGRYGREDIGSTAAGYHALFAGGGWYDCKLVDAVDLSLTLQAITPLDTGRKGITGASGGTSAVFLGGSRASGYGNYTTDVDAYTKDLVRSKLTISSHASNEEICELSSEERAFFAGGYSYNGTNYTNRAYVSTYDESLTAKSASNLTVGRINIGTSTVGDYALFAGGYVMARSTYSEAQNCVEAYNRSTLTRTIAATLSEPTSALSGPVGDHAVVFHLESEIDYDSGPPYNRTYIIEAYNSSLVKSSLASLTGTYDGFALAGPVKLGGYLLVPLRSWDSLSNPQLQYVMYDSLLTRSIPEFTNSPSASGAGRMYSAKAVCGNYAFYSSVDGSVAGTDVYEAI